MLGVVKREGDCHLYSTGGASRWDIGPGTVFVKALGGHVSDVRGEDYDYVFNPDSSKHVNENGLLVCNTPALIPQLVEKFMAVLKEVGQDTGPVTGL